MQETWGMCDMEMWDLSKHRDCKALLRQTPLPAGLQLC